jgi:glucose/arabinose dehydrogenase
MGRRRFAGRHFFATACAALSLTMFVQATPSARAADADKVLIGTFNDPMHIASVASQPRLLYIVEKAGRIRILRDELELDHFFLDISASGSNLVATGGERGLSSVAFPPDYETSGLFYVVFPNLKGDIELDEFKRQTSDPTRADPGYRRVVLTIPRQPNSTSHYGGQLQFGPRDGYLYLSTGDGGGKVRPIGDNSRRLDNLLGKILRIKPLPAGGKPYDIPTSNPYVGQHGRDEIYAYGLRQPWRFSFDGRYLILGDVGEKRREEINYLRTTDVAGANFGWPEYEGDIPFDPSRPGPDPAKPPILAYPHGVKQSGGACAIIGGYVAHDPNVPTLLNRYLYGDWCTGIISSFRVNVPDQVVIGDRPTGVVLPGVNSFGVGADNQIYISQNLLDGKGNVSRLVPPPP